MLILIINYNKKINLLLVYNISFIFNSDSERMIKRKFSQIWDEFGKFGSVIFKNLNLELI